MIRRGYSVDVGIVELTRVIDGKRKLSQYEIDFVVNVGNNKVYIQSALNVNGVMYVGVIPFLLEDVVAEMIR